MSDITPRFFPTRTQDEKQAFRKQTSRYQQDQDSCTRFIYASIPNWELTRLHLVFETSPLGIQNNIKPQKNL